MTGLSTETPVTFPAAHAGEIASASSEATTSIRLLIVMTCPHAIRPRTRDVARSTIYTLYDSFCFCTTRYRRLALSLAGGPRACTGRSRRRAYGAIARLAREARAARVPAMFEAKFQT